MQILYGKPVAEELRKNCDPSNFLFKKMVFIVNKNEQPSVTYSKTLVKLAESLEIPTKVVYIDENTEQDELKYIVKGYAENSEVGSILPLMPFPKSVSVNDILRIIPLEKDVDCMCLSGFHNGKLSNLGGTPTACVEIMKYYGIDFVGKNVVIINRSDVVGMPLANYLIRKGATVTVCHSKTANLSEHTKKADILIVAVGKADFITQDMVSPDCVIIDVGINFKDGKLCGDVSEDVEVKAKTPVPGGVGVVANMAIMRRHCNV